MRLIDADELLHDINKYHVSDGMFQHWVQIQQTIESERKTGKWIEASPEPYVTYSSAYAECSECGKKTFLGWSMNFCPHCGKYMRGEEMKSDETDRC